MESLYVGLDVSLKQEHRSAWWIRQGSVVREGVVDSDPEGDFSLREVSKAPRWKSLRAIGQR